MHVHAACSCCKSMVMSTLHVNGHAHAACLCCTSRLHVQAASIMHFHCTAMLHVSAACPCCISELHVHSACPLCMSMLHVHAACPSCCKMDEGKKVIYHFYLNMLPLLQYLDFWSFDAIIIAWKGLLSFNFVKNFVARLAESGNHYLLISIARLAKKQVSWKNFFLTNLANDLVKYLVYCKS
jgi:hypothetical protein